MLLEDLTSLRNLKHMVKVVYACIYIFIVNGKRPFPAQSINVVAVNLEHNRARHQDICAPHYHTVIWIAQRYIPLQSTRKFKCSPMNEFNAQNSERNDCKTNER